MIDAHHHLWDLSNIPVEKLYSDYATLVRAYREIVPQGMQYAVFGYTAAIFYSLLLGETTQRR
ncbi:MAG: hypothetical protein ABJI96_10980 [Paracoccaceae bacterium]